MERENKERTLREQREATRRREHELRVAAVENGSGSVSNRGDGSQGSGDGSDHADRDDDEDEDVDEPASEMNGLEKGHNDERMQSRVDILIDVR